MKLNKKYLKKASLELSVNFIVVAIISLVLLGIGMALMVRGRDAFTGQEDKINQMHKQNIIDAMSKSGNLVMIYPNTVTLSGGDFADFTLGINNELPKKLNFGITNNVPAISLSGLELLYVPPEEEIKIEIGDSYFTTIRVKAPKGLDGGSYIVNFCVFDKDKTSDESIGCEEANRYGFIQKIIVNVK